ncbi:hypothetical protein [Nonlabens xiamenensis]|uniref:hypothetical protein n=1 Tax=Nonlabens xiamenensis TaxID=2341043 RepID=UPI000F61280C|nr:hypothetical protein [Nonlabens xiamenensis]
MNDLLHKYWEGQTSLHEEQELRDYFNAGNVAPEHEVYRSIFNSFELEQQMQEGTYDAFAKVKRKNALDQQQNARRWKGLAIAAGFALLVAAGAGLYDGPVSSDNKDLGTVANAEEAREETLKMLEMVGDRLNKGKRKMSPMNTLENKTTAVFNLK